MAAYTWWQTPPAPPPLIVEVPVPAPDYSAEFSCSARCPAPVQQIVTKAAESSSVSALFWAFFGAALSAVAFLIWLPRRTQRRQSEPVPYLPVLTAGEVEEFVEPVVTRGVTPQRLRLRRQRALQDGA